MASTPQFIATPRISFGEILAAQTARTTNTSTNLVDVIQGAASGTRVIEIVVKSLGQPADSTLTLWLNNGVSTFLFDEYDLGAPTAGSTTVTSYKLTTTYNNLILPNASWKIMAGCTVIPTAGHIIVAAFGGDL